LTAAQFSITDEALREIATKYTREAGVRNLERAIGSVMRFKAVEWAQSRDTLPTDKKGTHERIESRNSDKPKASYKHLVEVHEVEKILGVARWDEERRREERRGVVYGLVVMGQGEGGVMPVESMVVPGSGKLILTGSLGEVRILHMPSLCVILHLFGTGSKGEWRIGS
jgi:ATP-dependent Lon protease